ncbi:hypothetical protein [Deinococcus sp. QL22]|uniref:hypothetical protein n=1 Tax=Deinococcus sp. QL22 TaxID=2939437 RepID=UPI002016DFC0|nr:hypothetical protein [Deinococcus sp. QL22]UQN09216.1 hypothetical protein M1R55_24615 [Deinococcus sp. QL22]
MGQAEPLQVAQVYAAGTIIDAPTLGYRLKVPPGYQAQLAPSEEAPGVASKAKAPLPSACCQMLPLTRFKRPFPPS